MAKIPPRLPSGPTTPDDFAEVEPTELHPTNNIRFVMWEVARLTERVEALAKVVEKSSEVAEKAADKQAANVKEALGLHASDMKDRLSELKADVKEAKADIVDLGNKVFLGKGALWVLGGIFALALVLIAAFAKYMTAA